MKNIRKMTAFVLCLLMLLPTQGITALAEAGIGERIRMTIPLEESGEEKEEAVMPERVSAVMLLEPMEDTEGSAGEKKVTVTLPLEFVETAVASASEAEQESALRQGAIYWNPGGSLPAELLASASEAYEQTATFSNSLTAATVSNAAKGNDRSDGLSPERPVKSLETALLRADELAQEEGLDRSDITIYAMSPMEVEDGHMYVLNGGGVRIASWDGRSYLNDTIFYLNGGQLTLMNASLESGSSQADAGESQLIHVDGGALQFGAGVELEGRIVMDYRQTKERAEWETATASDAAKATGSSWTETGAGNAGFDINDYILNTEEDEWELLEETSKESSWREPIIQLVEGFEGFSKAYLLEIRGEEDLSAVTLACTLYADEVSNEEFESFFQIKDFSGGQWSLHSTSREAAMVHDTGTADLERFLAEMRSGISPLSLEDGSEAGMAVDSEPAADTDSSSVAASASTPAAITVKQLSAVRGATGQATYWNPGPEFVYGGTLYPAGSDINYDGSTPDTPVLTLGRAMNLAAFRGGSIIVMQTLEFSGSGDRDPVNYLTTMSGNSMSAGAGNFVVGGENGYIPTLKVWDVTNAPVFLLNSPGGTLKLQNIKFEGVTSSSGQEILDRPAILDAPDGSGRGGQKLIVGDNVTAETGYIEILAENYRTHQENTDSSLKIQADSITNVNVHLFYSGINDNSLYCYMDVIAPTDTLLSPNATDAQKQEMGQKLMGCYHLTRHNKKPEHGGSSLFDWTLRQDTSEDGQVRPQRLELHAPDCSAYDAVYLDVVNGNDNNRGNACEYPVKTWAKAREIWEREMTRSVQARTAAMQQNPNLSPEKLNENYPCPSTIYICSTVTIAGSAVWTMPERVMDWDNTPIYPEISSHLIEGTGSRRHTDPQTLITVGNGSSLTLENVKIRNASDKTGNTTIRVSGGALLLRGTTTLTGERLAAPGIEAKEVTRGIHVEAVSGSSVTMDTGWSGSIENTQQGIVATGSGTTVTMGGGTIRRNNSYDPEVIENAQKKGGGIIVSGGAEFTMNGGSISQNKAWAYGGGVYVSGNGSKFTMNGGSSVSDNGVSDNTTAGETLKKTNVAENAYGVGIFGEQDTTITIGEQNGSSPAVVSNNKGYAGYGMGVCSYGTLYINYAQIKDNRGDTTFNGSENNGSQSPQYAVYGVGVSVLENGRLVLRKAQIMGNRVQRPDAIPDTELSSYYERAYGAGVYLGDCPNRDTVGIQDSVITDNRSGLTYTDDNGEPGSLGGGIYLGENRWMMLNNSTISRNRAGDGAGIYAKGEDAYISGCTIEENAATFSPAASETPVPEHLRTGGVKIITEYRSGTAVLDDCFVSSNKGVGVYGGVLNFQIHGSNVRTTISGNTGTGVVREFADDGVCLFLCNNIEVSQNGNGGVRANNGKLGFLDVEIKENRGEYGAGLTIEGSAPWTAVYPGTGSMSGPQVLLRNVSITNNNAIKNGGGVYIDNGTSHVCFTNVRVNGNTAAGDGGGVYIGSSSRQKIYWTQDNGGTSTLQGNSAKRGGGIYREKLNEPYAGENAHLLVYEIPSGTGNTAKEQGKDLYLREGGLYLLDGIFAAKEGEKYGIYLDVQSGGAKNHINFKKIGDKLGSICLNTADSALSCLAAPNAGSGVMGKIHLNESNFQPGSVVLKPVNQTSLGVYMAVPGLASGTVTSNFHLGNLRTDTYSLKDASTGLDLLSPGKLPRRTQLTKAQDPANNQLTNVILQGEGVYLSGTGDDNHSGTSPDQPVKTFEKAKSVLREQINGKSTSPDGYAPYIYICDTVNLNGNQTWEMDGTDTLYTVTNAAFKTSEQQANPNVDEEDLQPQLRRYGACVNKPMITVENGAVTMNKIIIDGMAHAVGGATPGSNPVIQVLQGGSMTLTGEAQVRNNRGTGIQVQGNGSLTLNGNQGETNAQLKDIDGAAVELAGELDSTTLGWLGSLTMNGYSGIVSERRRVDPGSGQPANRIGVKVSGKGVAVRMNGNSSIRAEDAAVFHTGVSFPYVFTHGKHQAPNWGDSIKGQLVDKLEMLGNSRIENCETGVYVAQDFVAVMMNGTIDYTPEGYVTHQASGNASDSAKIKVANTGSDVRGIWSDSIEGTMIEMHHQAKIYREDSANPSVREGRGIVYTFPEEHKGDLVADANRFYNNWLNMKDTCMISGFSIGIDNLAIDLAGGDQGCGQIINNRTGVRVDQRSLAGTNFRGTSSFIPGGGVISDNDEWGIQVIHSQGKLEVGNQRAIRGNGYGGIQLGEHPAGKTSEIIIRDSGCIENNGVNRPAGGGGGTGIETVGLPGGSAGSSLAWSITLQDTAAVKNNHLAQNQSRSEIYINAESTLELKDTASVVSDVSMQHADASAIHAEGQLTMAGTVSVEGKIHLTNPAYPIKLTMPVSGGKSYSLWLAEVFLGENVVVPAPTLTSAAPYQTNFVNAQAEGLASGKSIVAQGNNLMLAGENNVYLSGTGDDKNNGRSPSMAVRTFHRAKELLTTEDFTSGANIIIVQQVTIGSWRDAAGVLKPDNDWSFGANGTVQNNKNETWAPLVQRYDGYKGTMIGVQSGDNVTFKNIVIDGNKANVADSDSEMISISGGGKAVLGTGAVVQNGKRTSGDIAASKTAGILVSGGTLEMNGGTILGMELEVTGGAASAPMASALYCNNPAGSASGQVLFKTGEIRENQVSLQSGSGAAVVVAGKGQLDMTGGTIKQNTTTFTDNGSAENYGGALVVNDAFADIGYGVIQNNTGGKAGAIYYRSSLTEDTGFIRLSGGSISGNTGTDNAYGIYVGGRNFYLEGSACDIQDVIYLSDSRSPVIVSGDMYDTALSYKLLLNHGSEPNQYHKGSVVVEPDGKRVTDVAGSLAYFKLVSSAYTIDQGRSSDIAGQHANVSEDRCLVLTKSVFINGQAGDDANSGLTPSAAVKTFARAKEIGEQVDGGQPGYYVIYVCGAVANTTAETWELPNTAYMCRYTGFDVYDPNGAGATTERYNAYHGTLIQPEANLTIQNMAVSGRRIFDSPLCNGDSLIAVKENVEVVLEPGAILGLNNNTGSYMDLESEQYVPLSGEGGAVRIAAGGILRMNGGRITETDAAIGASIFVEASGTNDAGNGHLYLNNSPAIDGWVYLDGTGTATAAYVEPQTGYAPAAALQISLKNDYNGRTCVKYPDGITVGAAEMEHFVFEDSIVGLYEIISNGSRIELQQRNAIYLDGINGNDTYNGQTPETAVKSLKGVYQRIQALQQANPNSNAAGTVVYVVDTVSIPVSKRTVLRNVRKRDEITDKSYYEGVYQEYDNTSTLTSTIEVRGQVYFKRYSQPRDYNGGNNTYSGYNKSTLLNELFNVGSGSTLELWGMYLDGHSQETVSTNPLYDAKAVEAQAPLVSAEGELICGSMGEKGELTSTPMTFANNVNIRDKSTEGGVSIGQLNGAALYAGSAAGIELFEGAGNLDGKCSLNGVEFRNLKLGENVTAGATDIYYFGRELHVKNQTTFGGSVFLEGWGNTTNDAARRSSRFITVDLYGTPVTETFDVLIRDPYNRRKVVEYPASNPSGPADTQIKSYRMGEGTREYYHLVKNDTEKHVLELAISQQLYIDGVNGDDTASGLTPDSPIRTLKRAYQLLNRNAASTIFVVNTVTIDSDMTLDRNAYSSGAGETVRLLDAPTVRLTRYIQPDFARNNQNQAQAQGYTKGDFKGKLIEVADGNTLSLGEGMIVDGHSRQWIDESLPEELRVSRAGEAEAPLIFVQSGGMLELLEGSELRYNNNTFDSTAAQPGAAGSEGGAVYNRGAVTVSGAVFTENQAMKGEAAYQEGIFTIQSGVRGLEGQGFYLASTETGGVWTDHALRLGEKMPDAPMMTLKLEMDHAEPGREVIRFTDAGAYPTGADAEHKYFILGDTVPMGLFLVESENDGSVLELQDWKILKVEVPQDIYLAMVHTTDNLELGTIVGDGEDMFGSPEYEIRNTGSYDVKIFISGMDSDASVTSGINLKSTAAEVLGEDDLYLAVEGADTDAGNGLTFGETALLTQGMTAFEMGRLTSGSAGHFRFIGAAGEDFVNKYRDFRFPVRGTGQEAKQYMDGSGAGAVGSKEKYLLKYKVELDPGRR